MTEKQAAIICRRETRRALAESKEAALRVERAAELEAYRCALAESRAASAAELARLRAPTAWAASRGGYWSGSSHGAGPPQGAAMTEYKILKGRLGALGTLSVITERQLILAGRAAWWEHRRYQQGVGLSPAVVDDGTPASAIGILAYLGRADIVAI